jgi:hypothetical protein
MGCCGSFGRFLIFPFTSHLWAYWIYHIVEFALAIVYCTFFFTLYFTCLGLLFCFGVGIPLWWVSTEVLLALQRVEVYVSNAARGCDTTREGFKDGLYPPIKNAPHMWFKWPGFCKVLKSFFDCQMWKWMMFFGFLRVPLASLAFAAATLYIYVPLTWIYSTLLFWGKTFTLGPVSFAVNLTEAIIFFAIGLVCLWSVAWLVRAFGRLQCDLTRKFFAAPPSMAMQPLAEVPVAKEEKEEKEEVPTTSPAAVKLPAGATTPAPAVVEEKAEKPADVEMTEPRRV